MNQYSGTRVPLSSPVEIHIEDAKQRGFNAFGIETRDSVYLVMEMPRAVVSVIKVAEKPVPWVPDIPWESPRIRPGAFKVGNWWEIQTAARNFDDIDVAGEFFTLFSDGRGVFRSGQIERRVCLSDEKTRCDGFLERIKGRRIA